MKPVYGELTRLSLPDDDVDDGEPDALDSGSNKSAVVACDKLLKKQPKNVLVKVRRPRIQPPPFPFTPASS